MKQRLILLMSLLCVAEAHSLFAGSTELPIVERYRGAIALPADFDPADPVVVVRSEEDYSQFAADLTAASDPLGEQPTIDFATHMLVAVLRGSLQAPRILKVFNMLGHAVVQTEYPEHVAAGPDGEGTYAAVVIDRSNLKVFIQSTHPDGIPNP